ncbi:tropomyosin-1-like [Gossypium arboreum]|uniref:tropomyosin-1-like n=1 Tax=Gossypium arboreum TaxID=29729 RepID=UPI0008191407|nr:tropomyosin-1-like [Gossypium arboreum]
MKRLAIGSMVTPEYIEWFKKRVNDNILRPSLEDARPIGEQLQVAPSELEIIRQDFEKKSSQLGKKIEQLEEEKMHLKLDADVQRSEAEKWKKGKTKAEEDLDSLNTDYKKLRLSMRTAGLGKTSEQWRHEIREEKANTDRWERKFREAQARNEDLEKSLSESRNERGELKARVVELEKSLHQYRNHNTVMKLRASLSKIEEMKGKIEELEASLQNCEMRIQFFEANEDRWKEQLHHAQDQVRNRDYLMREAITQIREVADYLQTLAVQADTLSVKYELESDRGQELASLFRKIRTLIVRAKFYL